MAEFLPARFLRAIPALLFGGALFFVGAGCTSEKPDSTDPSKPGPSVEKPVVPDKPVAPDKPGPSVPPGPSIPPGPPVPSPPTVAGAEGLIGTWVIDLEAMKNGPGYQNSTPEQRQQMIAMMGMMDVTFVFTANEIRSKMGMMGQMQESTSKYKVLLVDGKKLTLSSTDARGVAGSIEAVLDGDSLQFNDPKAGSFTLKRK